MLNVEPVEWKLKDNREIEIKRCKEGLVVYRWYKLHQKHYTLTKQGSWRSTNSAPHYFANFSEIEVSLKQANLL